MKNIFLLTLLFTILFSFSSCKKDPKDPSIPNLAERLRPGGGTTIDEGGYFSFDNPAPNLNDKNLDQHLSGDAEFEAAFVTAPAEVNGGLGIQFNNTSCISCHPKDGRAAFPEDINARSGFFLRTSITGSGPYGAPIPVPGYGDQIQNQAVYGYQPESKFGVRYEEIEVSYTDGSSVTLLKPIYSVEDSYMPFPADAMFSPRIAPPVIGLGLLEAIPESAILAKQDIDDVDGDGISGKANYVWNKETNKTEIGRFGWKANTPTVKIQAGGAYHGDMGVTSPLFPVESDYGQSNGTQTISDPDITQDILDDVSLYCRTLAIPAARDLENPEVIRGYEMFEQAKCSSCHTPRQVTGDFDGIPAISNQVIYPFTDMLLHDMGDNLADGRPDFLANGNEWKTRPLWGIGLTSIVNGHTDFLHDGRAKSIEEAILWHGGEAENAQKAFRAMSASDRAALIRFVESI